MAQNIGTTDRIIRGVIALIFLYVGYTNIEAISIISYILGVIFLITAITGFCLIYKFLGISTKKTSTQTPAQQQQEKSKQSTQLNQPTNQSTTEQPKSESINNQPSNEQPKSPGWPTN